MYYTPTDVLSILVSLYHIASWQLNPALGRGDPMTLLYLYTWHFTAHLLHSLPAARLTLPAAYFISYFISYCIILYIFCYFWQYIHSVFHCGCYIKLHILSAVWLTTLQQLVISSWIILYFCCFLAQLSLSFIVVYILLLCGIVKQIWLIYRRHE